MKLTNNLFWKQNKVKLPLDENELENNVTHAFLFTVLKSPKLRTKLFKRINSNKLDFKFKNNNDWNFKFQVSGKLIKNIITENSILLFIRSKYNDGVINNDKVLSKKDNNRDKSKNKNKIDIVDGLLFNKKSALLIESKVSADKDEYQLNRYNSYIPGNKSNKPIELFWEDIYLFVKDIYLDLKEKNDLNDSLESFMTSQFKNYLELINLAGFYGIPFFDVDNNTYDRDEAIGIIKKLEKDLSDKDWFKKNYIVKDRPKNGAWFSILYNNQIFENEKLTDILHNSIYIFDTFFGIDCLFHKKELKYILKNKYDDFFNIISELSDDSDYYFKATHYKPILNKYKARCQISKVDYTDFEFCIQLSKFKKDCKTKEIFKNRFCDYLELLSKEDIKQYSIIKKANYGDPDYFPKVNHKKERFGQKDYDLTKGKDCLKLIKKSFEDLYPLIKFLNKI